MELIRNEAAELRKRLKDLNSSFQEAQQTIEKVQKAKDERSKEIDTFAHEIQSKLNE